MLGCYFLHKAILKGKVVICFVVYTSFAFSNNEHQELIDSLTEVIQNTDQQTLKAKKYLEHLEKIYWFDGQRAMEWNQTAFNILSRRKSIESISEKEIQLIDSLMPSCYNNMGYFHQSFLGNVVLAEENYRKALEGYQETRNLKGVSTCINNLASLFASQGHSKKGLEMFQKSLHMESTLLSETEGTIDSSSFVGTYQNIGLLLLDLGRHEEAMDYFKKSLNFFKRNNNMSDVATAYGNMAMVYRDQGNIPKALEYNQLSLNIAESLDNTFGVAISLNNLGLIYSSQEDYQMAFDYIERSVTLLEEVGNTVERSHIILGLVSAYIAIGQYEKALDWCFGSLGLARVAKNKNAVAAAYNSLGNIYVELNDLAMASVYYDSSLTVAQQIGDRRTLSSLHSNLGRVCLLTGERVKAIVHGKQSLAFARELGRPERISKSADILYKAYEESGRYYEAYEMYALHIQMRDSIRNQNNQKAAIRQQAKYEYEKAQLIKEQEAKEKRRVLIASMQKNRLWAGIIIGCLVLLIAAGMVYYAFQKKKNETLFQELRNQALRLQINPHFLFNAMNAISSFIGKNDAVNAKRYLAKFSRIMRLSLESVQSELVTLESEIEFISNYIEIEMIRNKNFEYEIKVAENILVENVFIPPILIQPYIENSIVHGFKEKNEEEKGRLEIEFSFIDKSNMKITIQDNGIGMDSKRDEKTHKSLALKITQKRLNAFAKKKVEVDFQKTAKGYGTKVSFAVPIKGDEMVR